MNGRFALLMLTLTLFFAFSGMLYGADNDLDVHFIDVGQGDSILVMLPSGQTVLIDGGTGQAAGKVVAYLKEQSVTG